MEQQPEPAPWIRYMEQWKHYSADLTGTMQRISVGADVLRPFQRPCPAELRDDLMQSVPVSDVATGASGFGSLFQLTARTED